MKKRILIAYYSRKGENYVNGRIENLEEGNTAVVARMIEKLTGGELFEIDTVNPYPDDYGRTTEVATAELREGARPELVSYLSGPDGFDTLFLGFPNWWGTMPMAVFTFLESLDLSGRKILPFCTHEGSGLGRSVSDIRKTCKGAVVLEGLEIRGGRVGDSRSLVEKWISRAQIN